METYVKYDKKGVILATCRVASLPEDMNSPFDSLAKGESVLKAEPAEDFAEIPCIEIHQNYTVDVKKKKVVPAGL